MKLFGDYNELNSEKGNALKKIVDEGLVLNPNWYIFLSFPIIEISGRKQIIDCVIVCNKGIFIFPSNDNDYELEKIELYKLLLENSYFADKISVLLSWFIRKSFNEIEYIYNELNAPDLLNDEDVNNVIASIQKTLNLMKKDDREISNHNSLGAIIKAGNQKIKLLDENQFSGFREMNTHMIITGLAGSGKTVLLVKKMAFLHYRYPDLKIAFVFFTISLKQFIISLFNQYYREYDRYNDPNENIFILHSWGTKDDEGFYSKICSYMGVSKKTLNDTRGIQDKFGYVCNDLLENIKNRPIGLFDYVFVDEGQDFSLPFYKMALRSLKPNGHLILAYDELQSLNKSTKMPKGKSIFGDGNYKTINLDNCYRALKEILVAAHALGLGIYRRNSEGKVEFANMVQSFDMWRAMGYYVFDGKLEYGKEVVLTRNDNTIKIDYDPVIIKQFDNEIEEYEFLSDEIIAMVENQDVISDDFMIIDFDIENIEKDFLCFREIFFKKLSEKNKKANDIELNLVNKDNRLFVRINNHIPFTTIFRAKGNESNVVFILNTNKLLPMESPTRNKIFTAMTRAKYKVYLFGTCNMETYNDEYNEVKKNGYLLKFIYPTKKELTNILNISQTADKDEKNYEKILELFNDLDNKKIIIDLLKEKIADNNEK